MKARMEDGVVGLEIDLGLQMDCSGVDLAEAIGKRRNYVLKPQPIDELDQTTPKHYSSLLP
eukprot:scaffold648_cov75-Skeletonema_dohrnii-CCMP3373.AAC.3